MTPVQKFIYCFKNFIRCLMSNNYPLTINHFIVEMGTTRIGFSEVSGLDIDHELLINRSGDSKVSSPFVLPGARKSGRLILRRAMMPGDNEFYEWINTLKFSKVERRDVVIKLLNESHEPEITWIVKEAWPIKLIGPVLNANSSDIAIETLELAFESMEIRTA